MRALNSLLLMILALGWSLPCCARSHEAVVPERWQSRQLVDHPLVGRIWDVGAKQFVSPARLHGRLQHTYFVLLGEVHSNPDHHRLQRRVIDHMVAHGRRPAVVFEMFERNQQADIERIRAEYADAVDCIAHATDMDERGWRWQLYRALVQAVLAHGLPLAGADLPRSTVRDIVGDGLIILGSEQVKMLALDEPLAPELTDELRADIVAGHCGHAPQELIEGMIAAQRARDAALADGLVSHAGRDGAVLIAGNGHVRNDLAAPVYLRRRVPDRAVASVAFTEVRKARVAPDQYVPVTRGEHPAFDYLWFTPSSQTGDPCEQIQRRLRPLDRADSR